MVTRVTFGEMCKDREGDMEKTLRFAQQRIFSLKTTKDGVMREK